jgi:hypothetical protein
VSVLEGSFGVMYSTLWFSSHLCGDFYDGRCQINFVAPFPSFRDADKVIIIPCVNGDDPATYSCSHDNTLAVTL